ncbi:MAG: glycosyltransferase family 39 protein [Cyanobacteriota bacterium]|nr:glycosyltransferase family 39 protein [Cyanobacteriota bacterium]
MTAPRKFSKFFKSLFLCSLLLAIMAIALFLTRPSSFQIRWNDETLYYTVAQNIARHFDFNSNHYLASSIIAKGYPTKDTHLPGYPLLLALGFSLGGINETTPFFVNYFLLALTLILLFVLGKKIANLWVGFFAGIVYLISPYTLILTHSVMTETSASAAVIGVVAILFLLKESWLKGFCLALAISLAYLIKPFLLALLPATLLVLLIGKNRSYLQTLFALFLTLTFLAVAVLLPLGENQEIYPYSATIILAEPSWSSKLQLMAEQFWLNCRLIVNFWQFPVYASITLSMLVLWLIAGAALRSKKPMSIPPNPPLKGGNSQSPPFQGGFRGIAYLTHQKEKRYNPNFSALMVFSLTSFMPVLLAIFLLYRYIDMGIRGLASFSALLSLLAVAGVFELWKTKLRWRRLIILGLIISICLGGSSLVTFQKLKNLQRRQSARLYNKSDRLEEVISQSQIEPRVVMSEKNFYLAIARYPTRVIWQLPNSLNELREVEKKVKIDLIELSEDSPLFQENLQVYGKIGSLDNRYLLKYQNKGFYYYFKQ